MHVTIREFLHRHRIDETGSFLIAVSGGADSIALLFAFHRLNLDCTALHCNFGLRGSASDGDEQFVRTFCEQYGIPLQTRRFDTAAYSASQGISIEMGARELRYNWFREVRNREQKDYIVTGHQADDLAETVLINLCRGTGIRGLTGIPEINGEIIRPLLGVTREQILAYLAGHRLTYRTDATNESDLYTRNKIRHHIIPAFREINPAFLQTVRENCTILRETELIYRMGIEQWEKETVSREEGGLRIHINRLATTPAPFSLLFEILHPFGFSASRIREIWHSRNSQAGKQFHSGSFLLFRERGYWHLYNKTEIRQTRLEIPGPGDYALNGQLYRFETDTITSDRSIPADSRTACLDADTFCFPLTVRNRQPGDRFFPLGMQGKQKKLSDFFTDLKVTNKQKKEIPLLTDAQGQILWVVGLRPDERFKVTSTTTRLLRITPVG
ncbi:MAG: tRNA lysidine(34) synthetase TilS [Culturomica sp.]|jgi:tRNA(Ile)-lysidine synthase|nr:tRNA lysidine(34) synthetase TilS [Culturomica sp.]